MSIPFATLYCAWIGWFLYDAIKFALGWNTNFSEDFGILFFISMCWVMQRYILV